MSEVSEQYRWLQIPENMEHLLTPSYENRPRSLESVRQNLRPTYSIVKSPRFVVRWVPALDNNMPYEVPSLFVVQRYAVGTALCQAVESNGASRVYQRSKHADHGGRLTLVRRSDRHSQRILPPESAICT